MKFNYIVMEEEPIGCFPNLAKTLIAEVKMQENAYLTAIIRSDASDVINMYASGYSILQEGFVPLVYRQDENLFVEETTYLLNQIQEIIIDQGLQLQEPKISFINLLEGAKNETISTLMDRS